MQAYHGDQEIASGYEQTETWQLQPYVFIPKLLLAAFPHDNIAVGIYCLVGRLNKIENGAVPLSAADIVRFMGYDNDHPRAEAERTRIMWAVGKLEKAGWLDVSRSASMKHTLLCTWGASDRLWDFTRENTNRPRQLTGIQLPTALIDIYIGQLQPVSCRKPAAIRRYFSIPLLKIDDIGSYALQRHFASNEPTERLRHLHLVKFNGVHNPLSSRELITQAQAGTLTTLDGDGNAVLVSCRDQGHTPVSLCEQSRSSSGSRSRSQTTSPQNVDMARPNAENASPESSFFAYGMDDPKIKIESIDSTTIHDHGGGVDISDLPIAVAEHPEAQASFPSRAIMLGHTALNPHRIISDGEWFEIAAHEQKFGYKEMLIWQARASRARAYQRGVVPAYYEQCAGRDILARYQPVRKRQQAEPQPAHTERPVEQRSDASGTEASAALDTEREKIVAQIEAHTGQIIVKRRMLVNTPIGLLRQWEQRITHAGLAARFLNPLAFAIKMMLMGNPPPPDRQLERWAAGTMQAIGDTSMAFARAEEVIQAHCNENIEAWKAAGMCDSSTMPVLHEPAITRPVVDTDQSVPATLQWLDVIAEVRLRLPRAEHSILQHVQLVSCTQKIVIVSVDTQAAYNKSRHYVNIFRIVLREQRGEPIEVRFVIRA